MTRHLELLLTTPINIYWLGCHKHVSGVYVTEADGPCLTEEYFGIRMLLFVMDEIHHVVWIIQVPGDEQVLFERPFEVVVFECRCVRPSRSLALQGLVIHP